MLLSKVSVHGDSNYAVTKNKNKKQKQKKNKRKTKEQQKKNKHEYTQLNTPTKVQHI